VTSFTGTVVARYRHHCLVEDSRRRRLTCKLQRRSCQPVVGDVVGCTAQADGEAFVDTLEPRRSELARIDSRGRRELIAANVTQLVVVLAADPSPDWFLVDRYLVAAELAGMAAIIAYNKADLQPDPPSELRVYAALNYECINTSAKSGAGVRAIGDAMREHCSVLIGQSGVGKSSLINALLGESLQTVAALSDKSGQGRHTTTTAVLYSLQNGGELIDSPGVRDYAPYIEDARAVARGFRELDELSTSCRFPDCAHIVEPDCAIKIAVADSRIDERRYASYRRLLELVQSLNETRYK